jgi:large subunit ribosomal protein L5
MANETKEKDKEKKAVGGGTPGGKPAADNKPSKSKRKQQETKVRGPHAGANLPIPAPRLKEKYEKTVRPKLMQQFGFTNPHQVPTLEKIAINVGVGEAIKQPKMLDAVIDELAIITGQAPVRKKAKKSIANYGLRQGQEIGAAVTLRGAKMWEFMDRFISVAVPRIRDFKGMSTRSFDGRGNYSLGIKEQMIFPEINYDEIDQIHGMDITFVTSVDKDDQAHALLKELGMPFRTDEKASKKAS